MSAYIKPDHLALLVTSTSDIYIYIYIVIDYLDISLRILVINLYVIFGHFKYFSIELCETIFVLQFLQGNVIFNVDVVFQ